MRRGGISFERKLESPSSGVQILHGSSVRVCFRSTPANRAISDQFPRSFLGHRLTKDQSLEYLDQRKEQGFNAVLTVVFSECE